MGLRRLVVPLVFSFFAFVTATSQTTTTAPTAPGRLSLPRCQTDAIDCSSQIQLEPGGGKAKVPTPFVVTNEGVKIDSQAAKNTDYTFVINGMPVKDDTKLSGLKNIHNYHIDVYKNLDGCRKYIPESNLPAFHQSFNVQTPLPANTKNELDNGIRVSPPKVYDSYSLRAKLTTAATQLSAISPWNAGAITAAYGNIQGITRDTSYFSLQAQTAPVPAVTTIANSGLSPTQPQTVTNNVQCPTGFAAALDSSGNTTCVTSTSATPVSSLTTVQTTAPNTQTTTTNPGLSPTIPAAPTPNPLTLAANPSASSSDLLVEQVQLNAQLQMYQTLLQGAQSDQILLRNGRGVGQRAQTTIGFQISLTPPRQYKHAIAEVRVIMARPHDKADNNGAIQPSNVSAQNKVGAFEGDDRITVVNLLPAQKTYNVAKVTSHQDAFGASAIIDQIVNVGVSTGRARDRLYLAKDTDTVALQYPGVSTRVLGSPWPRRFLDGAEEVAEEQLFGECGLGEFGQEMTDGEQTVFGWQFRPVLGADYVSAGPREVFAQLSLPQTPDDGSEPPVVYVQTKWRQYNEKKQVVGPVYRASCSIAKVQDSVEISIPSKVHDVDWDDIGNGNIKLTAEGLFLAAGTTVFAGGRL